MASQFSQFDGAINVFFIISKLYESENDCSDDMWEAFQVFFNE